MSHDHSYYEAIETSCYNRATQAVFDSTFVSDYYTLLGDPFSADVEVDWNDISYDEQIRIWGYNLQIFYGDNDEPSPVEGDQENF